MHLPPEVTTQLLMILVGIIGAAAVAIAHPFIAHANAYLEAKLGAENYSYAKDFVATIVKALEQSPAYQHFDGAAKKEAAIQQIVEYCQKVGVELDPVTIDRLIEEAVQGMNSELAPFEGKPLPMN